MVPNEDTEVQEELAMDEFSSYFKGDVVPKIAITTSRKPTKVDFLYKKTTYRQFVHVFFWFRKPSISFTTFSARSRTRLSISDETLT